MDYNTGAMRSPFSPRVRQSLSGRRQIGIGSGKNNPSKYNQPLEDQGGDVIYKSPSITLETYGPPLPVMVTEALAFAKGEVSVRLCGSGWCWLVAGRRLLAWPVDAASAARELTLPQTDLAHKAHLVMLFYENGAQLPSCIGVSPEGVVRYWASVGQEGAYVDVSCELAGQECERVACCGSEAPLVLATTTCTLVLLTPSILDGRATVSCRTLRPPSGWLGGIGRRVSLMFFGAMPAHVDTKLVGVSVLWGGRVALVGRGAGGAGPVLQAWRGAELHEHALRALLPPAPAAPRALRLRAAPEPAAKDLLLLFAHDAPDASKLYLAQISLEEVSAPRVTRLVCLRGAAPESPRLLPLSAHVLLYSRTALALHPAAPGGDAPDCLDLGADGDRILGGGLLAHGAALLFSLRHGLLRLRPHAPSHGSTCESAPGAADLYEGSLSLYEIDPLEISQQSLEPSGQLKTAFLFHVRGDGARCHALLGALAGGGGAPDSALDRAVVGVAREMLDDAPQGDPRWPPAAPLALARSPALQLAHQLADKRRALALYLDFLQAARLLPLLHSLTFEGVLVPSPRALCWLEGLLGAASALRARQEAGGAAGALVAEALAAAAREEEEPGAAAALRSGALSAEDVCYGRASRLPRALAALCARAARDGASRALVLELATEALEALARPRLAEARAGPPPPALLAALRSLLHSSAGPCAREASALADALLALAAPLPAAQLAALRDDLVMPFVEAGSPEVAAALAERHGALRLLAELCVRAGDDERLLRAARAHERDGFVELACSRLARARRVRTLVAGLGGAHERRVRGWLARRPAAALHALQAGAPGAAAERLARRADAERAETRRARTAASLGALSLAAHGAQPALAARLRRRLELCRAQAALPAAPCRPLLPEDLVQALAAGARSEHEYLAALEAAALARGAARRAALRRHVCCAAVLRDDWAARDPAVLRDDWAARDPNAPHAQDPAALLSQRCFFRLIDLLHLSGASVELVLPPLQELLAAPALAELAARPAARHLLQYGYECLAPPRAARA